MKIAIIGGGLAGLATAFYLKDHLVTLFDAGGGASRVAAGLMHKHHKDKLSLYADEAYSCSLELLAYAEAALGERVCDRSGLLREGRSVEGVTVWMDRYLQGLAKASGASIVAERLKALPEGFDATVVASGHGIAHFFPDLPVTFVKGQLLKCAPAVEKSHIASGYIAAGKEATFVGSTYERDFDNDQPDPDTATSILREKLCDLIDLDTLDVQACHAGVRVRRKGHYLPIVKQVHKGTWIYTALGSRGLLYHAFYAKKLAFAITMGENTLDES